MAEERRRCDRPESVATTSRSVRPQVDNGAAGQPRNVARRESDWCCGTGRARPTTGAARPGPRGAMSTSVDSTARTAWWMLLVRAVLTLVFGIIALASPGIALLVLV